MTIALALLAFQATAPAEFRATDYVIVRRGEIPIVLSAPHGSTRIVPGVPLRQGGPNIQQFTTVLDTWTMETTEAIDLAIQREFGKRPFVIIADFSRKQCDANRDLANGAESEGGRALWKAYHDALRAAADEVRRGWRAGLLLDIHGQGESPDLVIRGTRQFRSVSRLVRVHGREALLGPNGFLGALANLGWNIEPAVTATNQHEHRFDGGYITASMGSHQPEGIDTIQLELGSVMRRSENRARFARDLARALRRMVDAYEPSWSQPARTRERAPLSDRWMATARP